MCILQYMCTCTVITIFFKLTVNFVCVLCCSDPNQAEQGAHKVLSYCHNIVIFAYTVLRICNIPIQLHVYTVTCFPVQLHVYHYVYTVQYEYLQVAVCVCV